jgi:hypothetical protein
MKIALLFYGQARFIDSPYIINSFKEHILDKYDTDVFCHTWWSEDMNTFISSTNTENEDIPVYKNTINILENLYKPKILIAEKQINFLDIPFCKKYIEEMMIHPKWKDNNWKWNLTYKNPKNFFNLCSIAYSKEEIINKFESYCKNNNIEYDFIILSRYDLNIMFFPDLYILNKNKSYISNSHPYWPDELFITNYNNLKGFKIYSYIQHNINNTNLLEGLDRAVVECLKEACFYEYFNKDDVVPINIRTSILRGKYILNYGDKL